MADCHPARRLKAQGLCSGCYKKQREPLLPRAAYHPEKARFTRDGLCERCAERRRYTNKEALSQRRAWRFQNYLKEYGLSVANYLTLLQLQGGRCAICQRLPEEQKTKTRLVVDHDHQTGIVRGLLCDPCNRALGLLGDRPERVEAACGYLNGWRHWKEFTAKDDYGQVGKGCD